MINQDKIIKYGNKINTQNTLTYTFTYIIDFNLKQYMF